MHQPNGNLTFLTLQRVRDHQIDNAVLQPPPDPKNMAEEVDPDIDAVQLA